MEDRKCAVCRLWLLNGREPCRDITGRKDAGFHHPDCIFAGAPIMDRRSGEERRDG